MRNGTDSVYCSAALRAAPNGTLRTQLHQPLPRFFHVMLSAVVGLRSIFPPLIPPPFSAPGRAGFIMAALHDA